MKSMSAMPKDRIMDIEVTMACCVCSILFTSICRLLWEGMMLCHSKDM